MKVKHVDSHRLAFENIRHHEGRAGLESVVCVQRDRWQGEHTQVETAFYISSLAHDAKTILEATRSHWASENSLHWVLDGTFGKDWSLATWQVLFLAIILH